MHLFIKFSSGEHSSTSKNRTGSILQAHVAKVRAFYFNQGKRSRSLKSEPTLTFPRGKKRNYYKEEVSSAFPRQVTGLVEKVPLVPVASTFPSNLILLVLTSPDQRQFSVFAKKQIDARLFVHL